MYNFTQVLNDYRHSKEKQGLSPLISNPSLVHLSNDIATCALFDENCYIVYDRITDIQRFSIHIIPKEGYYRNRLVRFHFVVNDNYPFVPPKVICMDKIFHPNISAESGGICLNILREDWSSKYSISSIILGLITLLLEPSPENPLCKEPAHILSSSPDLFFQIAQNSLPLSDQDQNIL